MKLPNRTRAEVSPDKVRGYLLSSWHPIGRFKARFFRSLGYRTEHWAQLVDDLRAIANEGDAQRVESPFGDKFSIVANIVGPNGRSAAIVSIWILDEKDTAPRFVTAYPVE